MVIDIFLCFCTMCGLSLLGTYAPS